MHGYVSRVSFIRLTLYTAGDSCEQIAHGSLHGNSSLGLSLSDS